MHTKPYDKNDNDTYVERFGSTMAQDVEAHMFRDPKGRHRGPGNTFGHYSEESRRTATNNVLKFAVASATGLTKLKDAQLRTLVPMSLVHRYELNEDSLTYVQKTPIFYDTKLDKFVILMDYRFLRDMNLGELGFDVKSKRDQFKLYQDKKVEGAQYLGLLFSSMADLEEPWHDRPEKEKGAPNDVLSPYKLLLDAYKFYKMSLQGGEKVIVVYFGNKENEHTTLFEGAAQKAMGNGLVSLGFNFEYTVAVRFGTRYYACDKEGNILQDATFHLDKVKQQTKLSSTDLMAMHSYARAAFGLKDVFVVPYSQDQFLLIEKLGQRLHSLHKEFCDLFLGATQKDQDFDNPILSLPVDQNKLLPKLI